MKAYLLATLLAVIAPMAFNLHSCKEESLISPTRENTTVLKPTILSFDPLSGRPGATVTITGTNFSTEPSQNFVSFNGINATVTNATTSQITVTLPKGALTGKITVGTASSIGDFTVFSSLTNIPVRGYHENETLITVSRSDSGFADNQVPFNNAKSF